MDAHQEIESSPQTDRVVSLPPSNKILEVTSVETVLKHHRIDPSIVLARTMYQPPRGLIDRVHSNKENRNYGNYHNSSDTSITPI